MMAGDEKQANTDAINSSESGEGASDAALDNGNIIGQPILSLAALVLQL